MRQIEDMVFFETEQDKQVGVSRFTRVPDGLYFVFPFTGFPSRITTYSLNESIKVFELDRDCAVIAKTVMRPLRLMVLRPETVHVVEASLRTPDPVDFKALRKTLR